MARRADSTLMGRIATERANLIQLETDLRAFGDHELLRAVELARRELDSSAVSGAINTFGVNADAVRR